MSDLTGYLPSHCLNLPQSDYDGLQSTSKTSRLSGEDISLHILSGWLHLIASLQQALSEQ